MAKSLDLFQNLEMKIEQGKEAESNGDSELAIKCYEEAIAAGYSQEFAFDRLMILYRKEKKYKEELKVITKGIEIFKEINIKQLKENLSAKKNKKEIEKLSQAFMKSSGLIDRKGNDVHIPEPIGKWMKRKEVVEDKLKKKKK